MPRRKQRPKPPAVPARSSPQPSSRRRLAALVAILVLAVAVGVFWRLRPEGLVSPKSSLLPPPIDPRLTGESPYLNVRPEVHYVGDESCAGCHRGISASFHKHPMGQSLAPVTSSFDLERYVADSHNPFEASSLRYLVEKRPDRVVHREIEPSAGAGNEAEIAFSVGSGRRGRSYLVDREGYLFQSPISWYPLKSRWDLSPGYEKSNLHFNRPIVSECLFCHANQVEPDAHAANGYRQPLFRGYAIGCERCHGPGELHVAQRRAGEAASDLDRSIVNPRRLEHSLREAVCQQCHLQGEARVHARGRGPFEFRPGLPLNKFLADFVKPTDVHEDNKFVGTVEQMYASRCFLESKGEGKLGCITCHNPHVQPSAEDRVRFYRDRCLTCHADQPCSLSQANRLQRQRDDSCIACHMPSRSSTVPHTVITDHTIPRLGERGAAARPALWPQAGQLPLLPFPPALVEVEDPEQTRNLGIALVEVARKQDRGTRIARSLSQFALPLLDQAIAGDPKDSAAWEAKASALMDVGSSELALAACVKGLELDPDRETTLFLAAGLANTLRRPAQARAYCERGIKINPWTVQFRQGLAESYAQEGSWDKALDAAQHVLKLDAFNVPALQLLIRCYLQRGDKNQALAIVNRYKALLPPEEREALGRIIEQQKR